MTKLILREDLSGWDCDGCKEVTYSVNALYGKFYCDICAFDINKGLEQLNEGEEYSDEEEE